MTTSGYVFYTSGIIGNRRAEIRCFILPPSLISINTHPIVSSGVCVQAGLWCAAYRRLILIEVAFIHCLTPSSEFDGGTSSWPVTGMGRLPADMVVCLPSATLGSASGLRVRFILPGL